MKSKNIYSFSKKKNLVVLSVLLLLAVIMFNFVDFTGYASRFKDEPMSEKPYVMLSAEIVPDVIKRADYININIIPGSECVQRRIDILRENGRRIASFEKRSGSYKYCELVVLSYKTYSNWEPGKYSARVYEWCSGRYCDPKFVDANFTLT